MKHRFIHSLVLPLLVLPGLTRARGDVIPVPSQVTPESNGRAMPLNVVFILADDHRYDAMSFLGHPLARTPEMDRMAREGVYLKNALVTTSLCSPSRASILTGLYTFRHHVIDNNRPVPEGTIFFPQFLQKAGYKTAFIGKWHMGGDSDQPRPGFDHWVSFRGQGVYYPPSADYTLNVDGRRVRQKGYITDELTDYAVSWLEQQRGSGKPFFLYLSHKAVHAEFTPAPKYAGALNGAKYPHPATRTSSLDPANNTPRWLRDQRNSWHGVDFPYHSALGIDQYYRNYCETLMSVDDSIGRVRRKLDEMGVGRDTVVIYMGDNGFMFGEHGLIDKRVAYEASIRVPLLMVCPALYEGGAVVGEVVANIDIAPTVMDFMGLKEPAYMDGSSFAGLAAGEPVKWRDNFLYCYYWEKNFPQTPTVFALRENRFKYITVYGRWDADELYDLQADPDESRNLAFDPAYQEIENAMEAKLYAKMEELGGMNIPVNAPLGKSQNKRLRSRGGGKAADFPSPMVLEQPLNKNAK